MLSQTYQEHGIRFDYPSDWQVEDHASAEEIQVLVQSPGSAFWVLNLYFERPVSDELIESAIETYRAEYGEVDAFPSEQNVAGHQGAAVDIEFVCLDLPNTAQVRTFVTDRFTALILSQYSEGEPPETAELIKQMTQSIQCEEDLLGFQEL